MTLPDVNLLIYAIDERSPKHQPARLWLEQTLSGTEEAGFACWRCSGSSGSRPNRRRSNVLSPSPRPSSTWTSVWTSRCPLSCTRASATLATLRDLLGPLGTGGNLTELCSHDTDFARFPGLRWHDQLADR